MTSSMMTGDQRFPAKRRGGMTVLGKVAKVAAPKPLNLPSQRLENHGLDPTVEIVPKGTLSWGSRPSSSGSNAWATSALSPSIDGNSSPRHLAGRPLSGGGEEAHDCNVTAWGPNSRPSSASGVLGSNHASFTSLRPHSAETRPCSSHLSRFAEHSPESSGSGRANASSEQMGVNEGFSLSSGDFPTLGAEKDESNRNVEPQDALHGRPGSSSGGVKSMSDSMEIPHDVARDSDIKGHPWREDCPPFIEGGPRPSMERWHRDPHMYQNPNIGPPHYDYWRGPPPVNPRGGVWYRGPPGPPPHGGPVPPVGFHMKPYPYYPPQVPPPGLVKCQSIPPGSGHHGHHPENGDMYRPHLPESFMRPGVPMRPGFYPTPVPYEGYHRPPMGFCNPNERDLPFMGMGPGPIYNRPTNHYGPDINNTHPRSRDSRGPPVQVDPDHPHGPRGNYKVLAKQNDGVIQNDEGKWGDRGTGDGSNREKGILSKATLQENSWGNDYKERESLGYGQTAAKDQLPSRPCDNRFHFCNPANSKLHGNVSNVDEPGKGPTTDNLSSSRDHSLMKKMEVINAKVRASSGGQNSFHGEELTERVQAVNVWAHQSVRETDNEVVLERHYPTRVLIPVSRDANVTASEKSGESIMAAGPRRVVHGSPNRINHHGKGNFDGQEAASRWGRKSQSHSAQSTSSNIAINDQVEDHNSAVQPSGMRKANIEMKGEGESAISGLDLNDSQQAKMREIAKQRAIQLQKEEEGRIREQKAKAFAKLEELNRRSATQVVEASSQKEIVPPYSTGPVYNSGDQLYLEATSNADPNLGSSDKISQTKEEEKRITEQKAMALAKLEELNRRSATQVVEASSQKEIVPPYSTGPVNNSGDQLDLEVNSNADPNLGSLDKISQTKEKVANKVVDAVATLSHAGVKKNVKQDSVSSQNQSPAANANFEDDVDNRTEAQVREVTKHKRASYKPRQNIPPENNLPQKSIIVGQIDVLQDYKGKTTSQEITFGSFVDGRVEKELPPETPLVSDLPIPQKKRNNGGKNKRRVEDLSSAVPSTASLPNNSDLGQEISARDGDNALPGNSASVQLSVDTNEPNQSLKSSLSREDVHGKMNNSRKSQQYRKPRSSQGNRLPEKTQTNDGVVWAPVRSHNKELPDRTIQKAAESAVGENVPRTSSKTKRAEMERYVPKPVAKELAQQGSIQQSPSLSESTTAQASQDSSSGSGGRENTSEGSNSGPKSEPVVEGKNRHVKGQGSWRQRVSSESKDSSFDSTNKNIHPTKESMIMEPPNGSAELSLKGPETSLSDGWNSVNDPNTNSAATYTSSKGQFPSGKGKRHPFNGQKSSGNYQSYEHKDLNAGLHDSHFASGVNHVEKTQSSKENRVASDGSASHWQPKSQVNVAHSQQGKWSHGSQSHIANDGKGLKPDIVSGSVVQSQSQYNQSVVKDEKPGFEDKAMKDVVLQESKREKRGPHVKGHPNPASQGVETDVEPQRPSSGYRKNSNYGSRNRVYESRGDWTANAPESKQQHYSSANRERERQNSHYEYQAVGPYNRNDDEPQFENQHGGPGSRGSGHSRRGRGNFYGRQSGDE